MSTDRAHREETPDRRQPLRAVVEHNERSPDQCTLYPAGVDDHKRMATWISALEPSFVDLDTVR